MAINFNNIPVTTGSTSILINQTLVQKVTPMFGPDPASEVNTTYMPIWYVIQVLQRMGIQSSWNGSVWNLTTGGYGNLNSTTRDDSNLTVGNPTSITIFGWVTGESSVTDAEKNFGTLNQVGVDEFNVNPDGSVSGSAPAELLSKASTNHVSTYATVTNYDSSGLFSGSLIEGILNDSSTVQTLIQNLVSLAVNQSFTGINLDFENVPVNDEGSYMQFLAGLASALHDSDKLLNVTVPAETSNPGTGCYGAYNYQVIGQIADTVSVMTYDYTYINNAPGPIAPYLWDKQVMSYAVSQIPSHKVLLGMGAYGYDWSSAGGDATAITLPQIDQMIAKDGIHPSWDSADEVPYFTYISSTGQTHTVYYEDGQSLTDKLALVTQDDLGGVCIWRMGLEDTSLWDAIQTYEK
jgi:spore germination protein YaaH